MQRFLECECESVTASSSVQVQGQMTILKGDMLKMVNEKCQGQFADARRKASGIIEALPAVESKGMDSTEPSYALVSKVKLLNNGGGHHGRGLPKTGLLMNILGLTLLNGNHTAVEESWEFLNTMWCMVGGSISLMGNLGSSSPKIQ